MARNWEVIGPHAKQVEAKLEEALMAKHGQKRSLSQIAAEIRRDWKKVNYAAKPYLEAMADLELITDNYGYDSGKSVVLYFLSNATTWRGEVAKRVKAELKAMAK